MQCIEEKGYKKPDFLCFHWYAYGGTQLSEIDTFFANLSSTYPEYKGKIWITEFANATGNGYTNQQFFNGVYDLMTNKYNGLIERYSWFTNRQQNDVQGWDLINWDNGQPTDLGNLYKSKPSGQDTWPIQNATMF